MARSFLAAVLTASLLGGAAAATAQTSSARESMRRGLEAAAQGDTTRALALLGEAIDADPELAEAYYYRGRIFASQSSGSAFEYDARVEAHRALEAAIRRDPDNPRYLVEFGKLLLRQQMRVDARRIFQRALEAAARADAVTLAEVHYQIALLFETQWLRFRHRHLLPSFVPQLNADRAAESAPYVWRLLDRSMFPSEDQGSAERDEMIEHLGAALRAYPGHTGAATHMLGFLHDEERFEEYLAVADRYVRAAPSDPMAYMALGLGLFRQARADEAQGAFQYALSLMKPEVRSEFEYIGRILTEEREASLASLQPAARSEYQRRFWAAADPLFLTSANEFWVEYMARMAYVEIRFAVPEYDLRGWETDRGIIYVRYGEPARKASFSPSPTTDWDAEAVGKVTTVWSYGEEGPVFLFRQQPGYRRASFGGDFAFKAEDYRYVQPAHLESPWLPELGTVPLQAVRFRGEDGAIELEVHAAVPVVEIGQDAAVRRGTLETGLFIQTAEAVEVQRLVRTDSVDFRGARDRLESWSTTLPAGREYLVGVEARDPLTWRAAVGRVALEPKRFPAGELAVSDVLLANEVEPLVEDPRRRQDFAIQPNPAMTYATGRPIEVYFEIYNLLPDAESYAAYELDLSLVVEEIERDGPALAQLLGELADAWGLTAEGGEAAKLRFQRQERVLARDLIPEHFRVELPGAPPGRYRLVLKVRDLNADREVVVEREFHVR